ncbi:MAG: ABC-type transport auxiliary lipoprotein family protein [Candidatus Sulfobium sp.]|jgi:ABC-type uncharacterized transport system auxiliary subunit
MRNSVLARRRRLLARFYCLAGLWTIIVLCTVVATGCISGGKRTQAVYQYSLDYGSPAFPGLPRLDAVLTVSRFPAVSAYNSLSMVYSPSPFKRDVYNYYRWRVAPGDMTTDYLLRDLRSSGLFRAVFSSSEYEGTHFLLQGEVEKFLEVDEDGNSRAELLVNVTLLDTTQADVTKQVIFQKSYSSSAPIHERTPAGFAAGMSKAMKKLSADVIRDIYRAVAQEK